MRPAHGRLLRAEVLLHALVDNLDLTAVALLALRDALVAPLGVDDGAEELLLLPLLPLLLLLLDDES